MNKKTKSAAHKRREKEARKRKQQISQAKKNSPIPKEHTEEGHQNQNNGIRNDSVLQGLRPTEMSKNNSSKTSDDETDKNRRKWKYVLEWASVILLAAYAGLTAYQARLFYTSNNNFENSDRPWVGTVPIREVSPGYTGGWNYKLDYISKDNAYKLTYIWSFKNAGKRPALIRRMVNTAITDTSCTDNPTYDPVGMNRPNQSVIIPEGTLQDVSIDGIPRDKMDLINQGKMEFCVYIYVEYIDVAAPEQPIHHTTDCQHFISYEVGFAECRNRYSMAD